MGRNIMRAIMTSLALTLVAVPSCAQTKDASKRHDPFDTSLSPTTQSVIGQASAGPSLRVELSGSSSASMKELAEWSNRMAKWLNPGSSLHNVDPPNFHDALHPLI